MLQLDRECTSLPTPGSALPPVSVGFAQAECHAVCGSREMISSKQRQVERGTKDDGQHLAGMETLDQL